MSNARAPVPRTTLSNARPPPTPQREAHGLGTAAVQQRLGGGRGGAPAAMFLRCVAELKRFLMALSERPGRNLAICDLRPEHAVGSRHVREPRSAFFNGLWSTQAHTWCVRVTSAAPPILRVVRTRHTTLENSAPLNVPSKIPSHGMRGEETRQARAHTQFVFPGVPCVSAARDNH